MKIVSHKTKIVYDLYFPKVGENKMACPACSKDRKKATAKVFSFNTEKGVGNCIHCQDTFSTYIPYEKKKEYVAPEWKNRTELTDNAVKWFGGRMISQKTLSDMKVCSAMEYMPQDEKECSVVCFPYYRNGELVNIKYRTGDKHFKMYKDAELIFYNIDAIIGQKECIIVEGEIDCLSLIECGITNVVSVPNGAGGKNLDYIDSCFDALKPLEKIIIATDNDVKGLGLRDELIRRFGAERCYTVEFGDYKDSNECLIAEGVFNLKDIFEHARHVPVKDVIELSDIYSDVYSYFQNGLQPGAKTYTDLDTIVTWETGRVCVITGIPSHGKSTYLDFLITRLNVVNGWKVGIVSPENAPIKMHVGKIFSVLTGRSFDSKYITESEYQTTWDYVSNSFYWIMPESDMTIDNVLTKARYLVGRYGIRILVLDPYNKFEHTKDRGESETDYISRFLDQISLFAIQNNVLIFLVAHPTKMKKEKDSACFEVPTLYDISGSAHFYNKTDYGMIVYRHYDTGLVDIHVPKVRFRNWGEGGNIEQKFIGVNLRYQSEHSDPDYKTYLNRNFGEQEVPFQQTIDYQEQQETPF